MLHKILLTAALALMSLTVICGTGRKVYDITASGAIGDGKKMNTSAIQQTIDECSRKGGGTVLVPEGTFLCGTLLLKNNVNLHFKENATLLGNTDIYDYQLIDGFKDGKGSRMGYCFIGASDARNCRISGKGRINGNGKILLDKNGKEKRPFLIRFVRCSNILVSKVTLEGPAAWTMHFFECRKVIADSVIIRSRGLSNNDGIDIDCSQNVVISNCDIDSGDDAICLKTTGPSPCRNIKVFCCRINTNQGAFKLGTESAGNFENIDIHDCAVQNTRGIKLYSVDGDHLRNLNISDITIEKATLPVMIRLGARLKSFREGVPSKPVGTINDIVLKNITVESATQMAILICGIPGHSIRDVEIENFKVSLPGGGTPDQTTIQLPENEDNYPEVTMFGKEMPSYGMYLRHAREVKIKNLKILTVQPDARPAMIGIDLHKSSLGEWEKAAKIE